MLTIPLRMRFVAGALSVSGIIRPADGVLASPTA